MSNFEDRVREVVDPLVTHLESLMLPGPSEGSVTQAPTTGLMRLAQDIKTEVASVERIVKEISAQYNSADEKEKDFKEKVKEKGIKLFEPKEDGRSTTDRILDTLKEYFKMGQDGYDTLDNFLDVFKEYFKYKFRKGPWDLENILRAMQVILPFVVGSNVVKAIEPFVQRNLLETKQHRSEFKIESNTIKEKIESLKEDLMDCCEQQGEDSTAIKKILGSLSAGPTQQLELLTRIRAVQGQLSELRGLL